VPPSIRAWYNTLTNPEVHMPSYRVYVKKVIEATVGVLVEAESREEAVALVDVTGSDKFEVLHEVPVMAVSEKVAGVWEIAPECL
jgi:predicted secreted protein